MKSYAVAELEEKYSFYVHNWSNVLKVDVEEIVRFAFFQFFRVVLTDRTALFSSEVFHICGTNWRIGNHLAFNHVFS